MSIHDNNVILTIEQIKSSFINNFNIKNMQSSIFTINIILNKLLNDLAANRTNTNIKNIELILNANKYAIKNFYKLNRHHNDDDFYIKYYKLIISKNIDIIDKIFNKY